MKFGLIDPRPALVPHWSAMRLKFRATAPAAPATDVDYLQYLPDNLGMMMNDREGCCFWSAAYHKRQIDTRMITGTMDTEPDAIIDGCYRTVTGYQGTESTDAGTDPVAGFAWIQQNGLPTDNGPVRMAGAFEIDPRNYEDCLMAMDHCGGLMCGFSLPQSIVDNPDNLLWDYKSNDPASGEGHEVLIAKAPQDWSILGFVSWGNKNYRMSRSFWDAYCNQCTGVIFSDWVHPDGKTPFGATMDELSAELASFNGGAIP